MNLYDNVHNLMQRDHSGPFMFPFHTWTHLTAINSSLLGGLTTRYSHWIS